MQTISELGERALIERIRERVPHTHSDLLIGIGDDAAVYRVPPNRVEVITTDSLVEGVHFKRGWSTMREIGAKTIAVNLSDVSAMGAEPRLVTLSLALPPALPVEDFDELIEGIAEAAREAKVAVAGGNLASTGGPLTIDVTAIGSVHQRKILRRDGVRPGDEVYVTGTVGAGVAGLRWLEQHGRPGPDSPAWPAVSRACRPRPPVRAGSALSRAAASRAAIDLSDGLADGLERLAAASGCGLSIDASAIPVDPSARWVFESLKLDPLTTAVAGGDDYELLFTVPQRLRGRFRSARRHLGVEVTRIGAAVEGVGVVLGGIAGPELPPAGFDHFS